MLRIHRKVIGKVETLALEGRLVGPWLAELRKAVGEAVAKGQRVELDLSGVSFAHGEAAELLRELAAGGARVVRSSGFVDELLRSSGS